MTRPDPTRSCPQGLVQCHFRILPLTDCGFQVSPIYFYLAGLRVCAFIINVVFCLIVCWGVSFVVHTDIRNGCHGASFVLEGAVTPHSDKGSQYVSLSYT